MKLLHDELISVFLIIIARKLVKVKNQSEYHHTILYLVLREGKEHATEVPIRSWVVVKEPIRSNCGEKKVSEKDDNTCTPSVGDGVGEKEGFKREPTQVELEDRTIPSPPPPPLPSPKPIAFPLHLEEKKILQFLNVFKAMNLNLSFLELLEKIPNYIKFLRDVMSREKKIERGKKLLLTRNAMQ
ncbi:Integrase, catalytic core [Gossypium australe]|uniref:Integrase, catalytic core n=1 Tax=Gossypium australe TaxID=47621 RepID=A0A5B6X0J5_9ROSI|nr:Integrase, catalytic core [Gossypium australe]